MALRKKWVIPVAIVAAVLIAAGLFFIGDDEEGPGAALTLFGNVEIREVAVAFQASDRIANLLVEEGERVVAGQRLGSLETVRLEQAVAGAAARVAAQRQRLAALESGARPQEIRRARAEVAAAQAQLATARRTFQRLVTLSEQGLATPEQVDEARAALETAEARLQAARETLQLLVAGPRREEIAEARATLDALEAELAIAEVNLSEAFLESPVAGVVRDRILEEGEMASPLRPVYTIAIDDPLWVRAYLPEPSLGRVQPGMAAYVTTDTFPDKRYRGWVGYISPTAEFTPKWVQTEEVRTRLVYQTNIVVCNPEGELRLGMPAVVHIPLIDNPPTGAHECGPVE